MRCASISKTVFNRVRTQQGIMDERQVAHLTEKWLREALEDAEYYRAVSGRVTPEQAENEKDDLRWGLSVAADALKTRNYRKVENRVDALLDAEGLDKASIKGTDTYKLLCHAMLKAEVRYLQADLGRLSGDLSPLPDTPQPSPAPAPEEPSIRLSEAVEEYIKEKSKTWKKASMKDIPLQLGQFVEILGDLPLKTLTSKHIREYRDILSSLPSRVGRYPEYNGKTIRQIAEMNVPDERKLSPKTLETRATNISGFLNWAEGEGYIPSAKIKSPLSRIGGKKSKFKSTRRGFTPEELSLLFHSEEYTRDKHGKSWQFWTPIIALFTGARVEEICQLHLEDIREVDGVWCFDINAEGDKDIKTEAGKRQVPIHPFLIDLGLLRYADGMRRMKAKRLFPTIEKRSSTGKYSGTVTQWFTRYRRKCGLGGGEGEHSQLVFHSFRHTFISFCKNKQIDQRMIAETVGHESDLQNVTFDIYAPHYSPAIRSREVIEKVDFHETVGLDHLKRSRWTR